MQINQETDYFDKGVYISIHETIFLIAVIIIMAIDHVVTFARNTRLISLFDNNGHDLASEMVMDYLGLPNYDTNIYKHSCPHRCMSTFEQHHDGYA